jgi:hypothetical protein
VTFNGATAAFTVGSDTQITATVPSGATSGPITVSGPNGSATSSSSFSVTPAATAPSISGISPTSGPPGTVIVITGSAFTGATSVTLNGRAISYTVVSDTQIRATVPNGAKSGPIRVTTPGGTATSTAGFTVTKR